MGVVEIGVSVVDWIGLAGDKDMWKARMDAVMNIWVA
jgi:hypothetical protein